MLSAAQDFLLMKLWPQAHGVAVERPAGGVRAAAVAGSDRKPALRCLLFDSIQQGTQYCEECFLQVLTPAQATLQSPRMRDAVPAFAKHSCVVIHAHVTARQNFSSSTTSFSLAHAIRTSVA